jgi:hypothetical protein
MDLIADRLPIALLKAGNPSYVPYILPIRDPMYLRHTHSIDI